MWRWCWQDAAATAYSARVLLLLKGRSICRARHAPTEGKLTSPGGGMEDGWMDLQLLQRKVDLGGATNSMFNL